MNRQRSKIFSFASLLYQACTRAFTNSTNTTNSTNFNDATNISYSSTYSSANTRTYSYHRSYTYSCPTNTSSYCTSAYTNSNTGFDYTSNSALTSTNSINTLY